MENLESFGSSPAVIKCDDNHGGPEKHFIVETDERARNFQISRPCSIKINSKNKYIG